MKTLRANI